MAKTLCSHCDAKVTSRMSFCPNCKQPTVFATVEERTAWELEQWSKKRGTTRKKVVAARVEKPAVPAAKPKMMPAEQPADVPAVAATKMEPIKRAPMPRTIHPAVARARAEREAVASVATPEPAPKLAVVKPAEPKPAAKEKRVIVLPDAPAMKISPPAAEKMAPPAEIKKPMRVPKKAEPAMPAAKKAEPAMPPTKREPAPKKETASKEAVAKAAAPATKVRPKAAPRKAPKMAPMPIEMPAEKTNGNGNGHSNGHANGNGHAMNGNGHAMNGTAMAEQTEILRELLRRVTAIEEKMSAPRARRRWLKR